MLHKISEFCDKVDAIKKDVDKLRDLKYNQPKTKERDLLIQHLIDQIQADCYIISQDKSDYTKEGR
jgi:hypothetical protein